MWSAALPAVRRRFVPCAAGGFEFDGGSRVYLVDGSERALDGAEAELRVDVVDAEGAAASDARVIIISIVSDDSCDLTQRRDLSPVVITFSRGT